MAGCEGQSPQMSSWRLAGTGRGASCMQVLACAVCLTLQGTLTRPACQHPPPRPWARTGPPRCWLRPRRAAARPTAACACSRIATPAAWPRPRMAQRWASSARCMSRGSWSTRTAARRGRTTRWGAAGKACCSGQQSVQGACFCEQGVAACRDGSRMGWGSPGAVCTPCCLRCVQRHHTLGACLCRCCLAKRNTRLQYRCALPCAPAGRAPDRL